MKAILGTKVGMSQVFSPEGEVVPVTLVKAEQNEVAIRRSAEKDGHDAVQLALPKKNPKKGFAAKREFTIEVDEKTKAVGGDQFEAGDLVQVTGISKGKGYQGVVKRHHFKGGPASHGHRHVLRQACSIGAGFPQHVFKGMRMAGRMGGDQVTVKNLSIVSIDTKNNLLAIKGAVPGKRGTVLAIRSL